MAWTERQQAAIDTRDKTLIVSAAAGSGKTATLTQRIIESLIDKDSPADISRMLIVTFTRASAADLKAKISKALSKALLEDPENPYLPSQLIALGSAHISTIDSFYYEIVKNNFQRLSLTQIPRIADDAETGPLCRAVMEETIEDLFFTDGFDRFTEHFSDVRQSANIGEIFLDIHKKLQSLRKGTETLLDYKKDLVEAAKEDFLKTKYGEAAINASEAFFNYAITQSKESLEIINSDEEAKKAYAAGFSDDISVWQSLLGYIKARNYRDAKTAIDEIKFTKLSSYKGGNSVITEQKVKRDKLKKLLETHRKNYFTHTPEEISLSFTQNAEICDGLYRLLSEFDTRLNAEKTARCAFTFTDIRRFVLDILCTPDGAPTDIALEYRDRFDYIYIDEYQDVDDVQDAIFNAIARNDNRFMVGDIKQSIYSFRGANPDIFAMYKRTLPILGTADAKECSLFMSENFRCDKTVIDFSNTVSSFLFSIRSKSIGYSDEDDLRFAKICVDKDYAPTPVTIALTGTLPEGVSNSSLDDAQKAENSLAAARYIAKEINRLVGKEYLAPYKDENGLVRQRLIEYKDIAILARGKKDFSSLERELTALGIPVENSETVNFFENPEVLLVIALLTAIDNPQKDISLAGTLRSPIFGFSFDEIITVRTSASDPSLSLYDALVEYSDNETPLGEKCKGFISDLEYWRSASAASPCDKLIKKLYKELSLLSYSDGSAKNLLRLYEYAIKYESNGFKGLYGFIKFINELIESKVSLSGDEQSSDSNSVKLITIHHSKGLEFPVCFIYQCEKQFNTDFKKSKILFEPSLGIGFLPHDETGLAQYRSPLRSAISDTVSVLQREEEMRLLYVAMTRARERLYIVANLPEEEKKTSKVKEICKHDRNYAVLCANSYIEWIMMALPFSETPDAFRVNRIPSDVESIRLLAEETIEAEEEKSRLDQETKAQEKSPEIKADPEIVRLLNERFNFKYEFEHIAKLPAKLAVSALSPRVLDLADEGVATPEMLDKDFDEQFGQSFTVPESLLGEKKAGAAERGTATHAFLQFCNFDNAVRNGIDEELCRLKENRFISPTYADIVNKNQLAAFFKSRLYARLSSAKRVWREQRFNIFLPASDFTDAKEKTKLLENEKIAVQGVIDIFFEDADGKIVLCDYKTDYLTKEELSSPSLATKKLTKRHAEQLKYYAMAINEMLGKAPDEIVIYSLPLGDEVKIKT